MGSTSLVNHASIFLDAHPSAQNGHQTRSENPTEKVRWLSHVNANHIMSMDWFKGNSTGKHQISWEKPMVSCRFSLKPIHWFMEVSYDFFSAPCRRSFQAGVLCSVYPNLCRWKCHGYRHVAVCQNLVPLVNIKIAGKWMFIPLKMVLIGIDPYPCMFQLNLQELRCWCSLPIFTFRIVQLVPPCHGTKVNSFFDVHEITRKTIEPCWTLILQGNTIENNPVCAFLTFVDGGFIPEQRVDALPQPHSERLHVFSWWPSGLKNILVSWFQHMMNGCKETIFETTHQVYIDKETNMFKPRQLTSPLTFYLRFHLLYLTSLPPGSAPGPHGLPSGKPT